MYLIKSNHNCLVLFCRKRNILEYGLKLYILVNIDVVYIVVCVCFKSCPIFLEI